MELQSSGMGVLQKKIKKKTFMATKISDFSNNVSNLSIDIFISNKYRK